MAPRPKAKKQTEQSDDNIQVAVEKLPAKRGIAKPTKKADETNGRAIKLATVSEAKKTTKNGQDPIEKPVVSSKSGAKPKRTRKVEPEPAINDNGNDDIHEDEAASENGKSEKSKKQPTKKETATTNGKGKRKNNEDDIDEPNEKQSKVAAKKVAEKEKATKIEVADVKPKIAKASGKKADKKPAKIDDAPLDGEHVDVHIEAGAIESLAPEAPSAKSKSKGDKKTAPAKKVAAKAKELIKPDKKIAERTAVVAKPITKRGRAAKLDVPSAIAEPDEPSTTKGKRGKTAAKETKKPETIDLPAETGIRKKRGAKAEPVAEDDAEIAAPPIKQIKPTKKDTKPAVETRVAKPRRKLIPTYNEDLDDSDDDSDYKPVVTKRAAAKPKAAPATKGPRQNATVTDYSKIDFTIDKEFNLKISSWNVAGLRAMAGKGGFEYFDHERPDIICLQEIKCLADEIPEEAKLKGYHPYWNSKPGGHGGVAIYSKVMPHHVENGLNGDNGVADDDGRVITAEFEKYFVVCVYVQNAGRKLVTMPQRLAFNKRFDQHITNLNEKKPVIICGDMNVAHTEIDLSNPKTNTKNAGFTKEERDGMTDLFNIGFVDTFRHFYPKKEKAYTFWSYMGGNRAKNVGWRLDYYIVSERLIIKVVDNVMRSDVLGSDHCPIVLYLNL